MVMPYPCNLSAQPDKAATGLQQSEVAHESMEKYTAMQSWLKEEFTLSKLCVKRIPFNKSREWRWSDRYFLTHRTQRFFQIVGVRYFSIAHARLVSQPIIDQPEIGQLAFLVYRDAGEWWILAHAKVEPGNVNGAQLAPTVQATKSNYEVAHGGAATAYLDSIQSAQRPLYSQLQSEQNSRFLKKRNCNSVVLVNEKIEEKGSHFKWVPLSRFLSYMRKSHTVNTDARSVLACWLLTDSSTLRQCLPYCTFSHVLLTSMQSLYALHPAEELDTWLKTLNKTYSEKTTIISLQELDKSWNCSEEQISSPQDPSLLVYQIAVSCKKREVEHWDQPIAGSGTQACIILLIGSCNNTLHLLLQAKKEAGNRNGFELTTTVQADSFDCADAEKRYIELSQLGKPLVCFENSEEGGRFDRCISSYKVIWMDDINAGQEGPFHRWVSLSQVSGFLRRENIITNELRSSLSSLLCCPDL